MSGRAMIFPFAGQFHPAQWLFVWRPRGLLNEKVVGDVEAALGQLEVELHEPFIDSRIQLESGPLISTMNMSLPWPCIVALLTRIVAD